MLSLLIIICSTVYSDSVGFGTGIGLSVTHSIDLSYSYEHPLSHDRSSSFILSGGPLLCSDWHLEELSPGVELETELRGYKNEGLEGFFVSGAVKAKILWLEEIVRRESIELGVKFGWKEDLQMSGFPVDLEPNWVVGIMMDNDNSEGWDCIPKPFINFDIKIAVL